MTVLFADLKGSTAFIQHADPEEALEFLEAALDAMQKAVERYGGHVAKRMGDGLMALFGAPVAQSDHALRACWAALDLPGAVERAAPGRRIDAPRPGVRIGVDTGLVVVSRTGTADTADVDAMGATVHRASRVEGLAEPGCAYVTEATWLRVADRLHGQLIGPRRVKGIDEPITVHRLIGRRGEAGAERFGRGEQRSPLMGREPELALLRERLARLEQGVGGLVLVSGGAGVGKTRLMDEVRTTGGQPNVLWLDGRAPPFGERLSFWPIIELLRAQAGIGATDASGDAWRKLEASVTALCGDEVDEVLPYLALPLGLEPAERYRDNVRYLDGEAALHQILRASRRFFERLARSRPVALVFDDLHWIDQSSRDLIIHLLPVTAEAPLLICGLARDDGNQAIAALRGAAVAVAPDRLTEIALTPLSRSDEMRLIEHLVAPDPQSRHLREAIHRKAEGNPFFVEEVVRALAASGALVRDATGRLSARGDPDHIVIPDSIQGALLARVDRLDEPLRDVLRLAAIIGRNFLYRVLDAVSQRGYELDRRLGELRRVDLIDERTRLPEIEYMFKHVLVQETVYDSILLQRRRELHRRVAVCLEDLFADRIEEFQGILAFHYTRAEDWEKAQHYLFKAADQASRLAADPEALLHYQEAFDAYTRVFGDRWDPIRRAQIERRLGEIMWRRGETQVAFRHMSTALGLLGERDPAGLPMLALHTGYQLWRQAWHRLLPRLFVAPPATRLAPADEERARLFESLAWMQYLTDQRRLFYCLLRGLNFAERVGEMAGAAKGNAAIGYVFDVLGAPWMAQTYHRRALDYSERSTHIACRAIAQNCFGLHCSYTGDWARAISSYEAARLASREAGDWVNWGSATAQLMNLMCYRGDFAAAFTYAQEMGRVGAETGFETAAHWGVLGQGASHWRAGRLSEGVALLEAAVTAASAAGDHQCLVHAQGELARCLQRMGQADRALALLHEGRAVARRHMVLGHNVANVTLGLAAAALAQLERATERDKRVLVRRARRAVRAALRDGRVFSGARPEAARLAGTLAWLRGRMTKAERWWERSRGAAEALSAPYELALSWLESGSRTHRTEDLRRAENLFLKLGLAAEAAHARAASAPHA